MEDRPAARPDVTPEDLERERLRTYVEWAQVRAPAWFWPAYALAVAAWLAGYELGPLWGGGGALLVVAVVAAGLRAVAVRGQVSTPRLRGMPRRLKLAYLPAVVAALWFAGVLLFVGLAETPPRLLLGAVTGLALAIGGAWTSRRFRVAARRVAEEAGIPR